MKLKALIFMSFVFLLLMTAGCEKKQEEKIDQPAVVYEDVPVEEHLEEPVVFVNINKFSFEPENITIVAGTTVVWKNYDDRKHFIRTPQEGFQSPVLNTSQQFNLSFDTPNQVIKYVEPNFGVIGYINIK